MKSLQSLYIIYKRFGVKQMEKYINYEMCKECGGLCCQQNGCIYLPEDFKRLSFNFLQKQIDKGKISIAGQPFNGFLRDGWTFLLYLFRKCNCQEK